MGKGADGIVYKCEKNGVFAAIKIYFREALAANGLEESRQRLELQLSLIGDKLHPCLVQVYEGGEDPVLDTLYIVMEFVPGTSLDKLAGKVPPHLIPALVEQLAHAAKCLEDKGLVHRDIKPANIIVSDNFNKLTLLDLGIVHQIAEYGDDKRLSGEEFVSSPRYCPPEFVWRQEEADTSAWRAVTFYQIGAVTHDMVMGFPIFEGSDKPRVKLYDSIRDVTPEVESDTISGRIILTAKGCLVKDWRERLSLVSWDSFNQISSESDVELRQKSIKLKQVRAAEMRKLAESRAEAAPQPDRELELWTLKNQLGSEFRTYVLNAGIFPRCNIEEITISTREYQIRTRFAVDVSKGIASELVVLISLGVDPSIESATKLVIKAIHGEVNVLDASWTEMYNGQSAFDRCQAAMLDILDQLISD